MLPIISDYKHAVKNPESYFDKLLPLEMVPDERGFPKFASGNFAVVFKMRKPNNGKMVAIKCFHREAPQRHERLQNISDYLRQHPSNYWVSYEYLSEELYIDSTTAGANYYPVVYMEWAEGVTLFEKVQHYCNTNNKTGLQQLSDAFNEMALWLLAQPIAHGDLKHDNILVSDAGKIVLVDYDGMYLPQLASLGAAELGGADYQHPMRNESHYNRHIDDYSIAVIAVSLQALALQPELFGNYNGGNNLIISRTDLLTTTSPLLQTLRQLSHPTINQLLTLLQESIIAQTLQLSGLAQALQTQTLHLPPTIAETQNLIAIKKQEIVLLENHLQTLQYRTAPKVAPPPLNKIIETVNNINLHLIRVEGGTFNMGGQDNEVTKDEEPVHRVTLDTFYIGIYPVTQAQYRVIMGYNPSYHFGDSRPVENVSWKDAVEFCHRLSDLTGKTYRLPTEAEWEYAARGGNKSRNYKYAGSNNLGNVAWYTTNSGFTTHAVGRKSPNELGLYDMSGNVWEWCWDWFDSGYYKVSPAVNPRGPASGTSRVLRGGSWGFDAQYCRVSFRYGFTPGYRHGICGFRLVVFP